MKRRSPDDPYPPAGSTDPHYERHGKTAEDAGGVGEGEEGFRAEDYPGHNPLQNESSAEQRARARRAWDGPHTVSPDPEQDRARRLGADVHILEEACDRLRAIGFERGDVELAISDGELMLSGEVEDLETKQSVEGVCGSIVGVRRLESLLRVRAAG